MASLRCSIVIPAYNESARIALTLEKVLAHVRSEKWNAEIIVVNDGSRDDTASVVRECALQNPNVHLLENPGNRGKGYSVRHGMLHASGDYLLFTDADLSSPIEEAGKLFDALRLGADVAIGSRWLDSGTQTARQSLFRQMLGRAFNLALRMILNLGFKDTQCGFKAFKLEAARAVFPRQRIEGWGFDPELLFLAKKFKLKVSEVPVSWAHDHRSKISPVRDGMRMGVELLKIRWNSLSGKYAHAVAEACEQVIAETKRPA